MRGEMKTPPFWKLALAVGLVLVVLLLVFAAGGPLALLGQPFD